MAPAMTFSGCFSEGSEVTVATTFQPEGEAAFSYSAVVVTDIGM